jgi:hypothetical protein
LHNQIVKRICKGTGSPKSQQGVKADTLTALHPEKVSLAGHHVKRREDL